MDPSSTCAACGQRRLRPASTAFFIAEAIGQILRGDGGVHPARHRSRAPSQSRHQKRCHAGIDECRHLRVID